MTFRRYFSSFTGLFKKKEDSQKELATIDEVPKGNGNSNENNNNNNGTITTEEQHKTETLMEVNNIIRDAKGANVRRSSIDNSKPTVYGNPGSGHTSNGSATVPASEVLKMDQEITKLDQKIENLEEGLAKTSVDVAVSANVVENSKKKLEESESQIDQIAKSDDASTADYESAKAAKAIAKSEHEQAKQEHEDAKAKKEVLETELEKTKSNASWLSKARDNIKYSFISKETYVVTKRWRRKSNTCVFLIVKRLSQKLVYCLIKCSKIFLITKWN